LSADLEIRDTRQLCPDDIWTSLDEHREHREQVKVVVIHAREVVVQHGNVRALDGGDRCSHRLAVRLTTVGVACGERRKGGGGCGVWGETQGGVMCPGQWWWVWRVGRDVLRAVVMVVWVVGWVGGCGDKSFDRKL
jgi:hypothetical protein